MMARAARHGPRTARTRVFISYSHADHSWLEQIRVHLKPLERERALQIWSDKLIRPGDKWYDEIQKALASTKVAVLLVSPSFLASDFIDEVELPTLLQAAETDGLRLLWVPLDHCSWHRTKLKDYQAAIGVEPLRAMRPTKRNKKLVEFCDAIYEALAAPLAAELVEDDAELDREPVRRGNLNLHLLPRLVGREEELSDIRAQLQRRPLVTLLGAGGCGKTALAKALVRDVESDYADGYCFVELASLRDPELVPQEVAEQLGILEQARRPPTEVLAEFLSDKELLLVLDNCEHVLEACAFLLRELLENCPHLRVLATTRQRLRVSGETICQVRPLAVPVRLDEADPKLLSQVESVRLFVERASDWAPDFELTAERATDVAKICSALSGIPLAIELAAARLAYEPVAQMAKELDRALAWLTDGDPTEQHHTTLEATIDWSYELRKAPEKRIFSRLAVFDGGWSMEAAGKVAGKREGDPAVRKAVYALAEASMVQFDRDGPRWRFLEPIRQYALSRLSGAEAKKTRQKHRDWYVDLARRGAPELLKQNQTEWIRRLELEHDNLRAALRFSIEANQAYPALALGAALWRFWEMRGYLTEGRDRLTDVLTLAVPPEADSENARALLSARAQVLRGGATIAYREGRPADARLMAGEAYVLDRELGDKEGMAVALNDLGIAEQALGEFESALEHLKTCLALQKELGKKREIAVALFNLGLVAFNLGRLDDAQAKLEESLERFESAENWSDSAYPLTLLGLVDLHRDDVDSAERHLQESFARRERLGDKRGMGDSLGALGLVAAHRGDLETARERLREAWSLRQEVGDQKGTAANLDAFAKLSYLCGETERAVELAACADRLRTEARIARPPIYERDLEDWRSQARVALDDEAFARAEKRGRSWSLDEAAAAFV